MGPPMLVHHGSFSLNVNYHAFITFCQQSGGVALFPTRPRSSLTMGCLLFGDATADYEETRRIFRQQAEERSPEDFLNTARHAAEHQAGMDVGQILSYVHLGNRDPLLFRQFLPRLLELVPSLKPAERAALLDAIERVWALHFPLGGAFDLAYEIAGLLYEMDEYPGALQYFQQSLWHQGRYAGTLFNMAACHHLLGQHVRARSLLREVVRHDPANAPARALLGEYESR